MISSHVSKVLNKKVSNFDEILKAVFKSLPYQILVNGHFYPKSNVNIDSCITSFFPYREIQSISIKHPSGANIVLLAQAYINGQYIILSDLTDSQFQKLIIERLSSQSQAGRVLRVLDLRSMKCEVEDKNKIVKVNLPQSNNAIKKPIDGDNFTDVIKGSRVTLFFNYHEHQDSYQYISENIEKLNKGELHYFFIEIGTSSTNLFADFNKTGDEVFLRTYLDNLMVFINEHWKEYLIHLAKICFAKNIELIPVDKLVVGDSEIIESRNEFIAKQIHHFMKGKHNKKGIGLFGATHYKIAEMLQTSSVFLSPDLSNPNLDKIVLAPQWQGKIGAYEVRGFLQNSFQNFSKVIQVDSKPAIVPAKTPNYTKLGLFGVAAIGTVAAVAGLTQLCMRT